MFSSKSKKSFKPISNLLHEVARIFKKSEFANVLKQSTEEGLRNL